MFPRGFEKPISLSGLQDEMSRLIERVWHSGVSTGPLDGQEWAPPVDMYESPDRYTLYAELPGVEPSAVEVSYLARVLTIRGEKVPPPPGTEAGRTVRHERRFGTFCRSVDLPADVDADRLSATFHAGVLEVTLPKSQASVAKSVKVNVTE
ncbi:MAG TPA: Hsp20/alpha crystallin family protein [Phycisphaerae bacterium]|nr:Hsp20/alpha crystallin family protein [Phycisphaerae bacterium]HNU44887.1 Hsp20/alpha crystallin family protein [Phycisphaerae bacterium]